MIVLEVGKQLEYSTALLLEVLLDEIELLVECFVLHLLFIQLIQKVAELHAH